MGGVPVAEVESQRDLLDALGFDHGRVFAPRTGDAAYFDFAASVAERGAIRLIIENDLGIEARTGALRQAYCIWWTNHCSRLENLPTRHNLNAVRAELLDTFVASLLPVGLLDRFKLAGVAASWWTETLPDFKTLLENSFAGVIDGWVDAIADAVEDDEAVGPMFDPFGHKLVRHTMADYLERIGQARTDIARLKGEKTAFEQSNAPEDADEEELENWNYAKDLERQIREIKTQHRDDLKELAKLAKTAAKTRATDADRQAFTEARLILQAVLDELTGLEASRAPYERIKKDLSEARSRYRELINAFVDELRNRCSALDADTKRSLVLDLFAQDVAASLDEAVHAKREMLVGLVTRLWDKYRVTLHELQGRREDVEGQMREFLRQLRYQ
jgi:type I restriction enzyme M protein